MKSKFFSVLTALPLLFFVGCVSKKSQTPAPLPEAQVRKKIEVHGHRGSRARFPENTIPAFEEAMKAGADALEMDLNITRDGIVIVNHDPRVNLEICKWAGDAKEEPTPSAPAKKNRKGKAAKLAPLIHDLDLATLKKYDCGSKPNKRFPRQESVPGTQMPTLAEVFDFVDHSSLPVAKKIRFNIETKIDPAVPEETVDPATFTRFVLDEVYKHQMMDRVILESFDFRTLIEARKIEPKIIISALVEDKKVDMVEAVRTLHADYISPDLSLLTEPLIREIHAAGALVLPWTVNRTDEWASLIHMGVDGILTDDPRDLINFLK